LRKWAKDASRSFSKEDVQIANSYVKKCLASLVKCKLKPQGRFYFSPVRTATVKNVKDYNVGEDVEKRKPLPSVGDCFLAPVFSCTIVSVTILSSTLFRHASHS
jgi:hypothetical protein